MKNIKTIYRQKLMTTAKVDKIWKQSIKLIRNWLPSNKKKTCAWTKKEQTIKICHVTQTYKIQENKTSTWRPVS